MAKEPTHDAFRAAIKAKISAWQAVLDSYDAAVSLDAALGEPGTGAPAEPTRGDTQPAVLPVGVFRDKGIKESIPIYLAAARRRQANKAIAGGLLKGGIASTAQNFESAVATALSRLKDDGVVLRFPDGWDLASSYPDSLRNRLSKEAKPPSSKPAKQRKAATVATVKLPESSDDKTAAILRVIESGGGIQIRDIRAALEDGGIDISPDYVRVVTKRLIKRGAAERRDGKLYARVVG